MNAVTTDTGLDSDVGIVGGELDWLRRDPGFHRIIVMTDGTRYKATTVGVAYMRRAKKPIATVLRAKHAAPAGQ